MSDIVISEFMDQAAIDAILRGRDVLYDPKLVDDKDRLYAALADCRALIVRNRTQVRAPLLDAAPRLKVVGRLGVGLDNIDVDACAAHKIIVRPASGANGTDRGRIVRRATGFDRLRRHRSADGHEGRGVGYDGRRIRSFLAA